MVSAWDIYAEQLFTLGYGHPLWVPEPCVESGEICIGDVGYLRAGGFRFIFSSMKEQDHPRNTRIGVPQGFQPFRPPGHQLVRRPNEIMQGQLHSANLRSTSLSGGVSVDAPATSGNAILRYHCSDSSGAILLLKRAGHYELLDCRLHIKTYMLEHISRWHEFANGDLGIGLQEKEILFVSGFIKTTEWAAAAFRSGGSNGELSISGGFLPLASVSGEFSVSMTRCDSPAVFYRSGPTRSETERLTSEDVAASDQCIFLHYYKMKSRIIWPTIRAAAGPHNLPPGSEDPEHDIIDNLGLEDIESTHDNPDKFDPVGCLLDYILEHSEARVAFASSQDAIEILKRYPIFSDLKVVLQQRKPDILVDSQGVGVLSIMYSACESWGPKITAHCSNVARFNLANSPGFSPSCAYTCPLDNFGSLVGKTIRAERRLRQVMRWKAMCVPTLMDLALGLRPLPLFWFLTPPEAYRLFEVFFAKVNNHYNVLDKTLHTVPYTIMKSPTLFIIVCTIAARYDVDSARLLPHIVCEAKRSAQYAMLHEAPSLELVQAYVLMAMYDTELGARGVDKSPYLRLATRTLKTLGHSSSVRRHNMYRSDLARLRLLCYIMEHPMVTGLTEGPQPHIKLHDSFLGRACPENIPLKVPSDITIGAYLQILQITARYQDTASADLSQRNTQCKDTEVIVRVLRTYEDEVIRCTDEWTRQVVPDTAPGKDMNPCSVFHTNLVDFLGSYATMAFCSTLLLRVSPCSEASAYLYGKAFHYAKLVVIAMVDTLIPCGIMQSSPELTFLHASAAAKFLTQSASAYSITQQLEIKTLLYQLSRSYSSPDATIDHIHAPARHAAHINRLIDDLGP